MELERFRETGYDSLPLTKWILPSGTEVEATLHAYYSNKYFAAFPASTPGCSYILDVSRDEMKNLFSESDWLHIVQSRGPFGAYSISPLAEEYLEKMKSVMSLGALVAISKEMRLDIDTGDDDVDWLFDVVWHCRRKLFQFPDVMKQGQHEAFYSHHVWAPIIDSCFLGYFTVVRGEIGSNATRQKLNPTAPRFDLVSSPNDPEPSTTSVPPSESPSRIKSGPLSDAIFRDPDSLPLTALEYGASECAREFGGKFRPKFITDTNKLVILLRDQLVYINQETGGSSNVLRTIQTVGFITSGFKYQSMRACCPVGNVTLLIRGPLRSFPERIGVFGCIVPILKDILRCRHIMMKTRDIVRAMLTVDTDFGEEIAGISPSPNSEVEFLHPSWTAL